ncbi:MAG: amino-acid N-acetyltransferase [Gammaproteobacteria bacterium]|nr:amino-acid N-acetyltransferase [Gammaproteobacteria bacterium]NNJ51292.1 amino-acid N-acetyltransferase [Gammaproteobacteria bacterium]
MIENNSHVDWFRQSAPYIHAHRGRTFVILFGGEAVEDSGFANLIHDLALLGSLGVRIVLVHGARPQIERQLTTLKIKSEFADNMRITLNENMPAVEQAVGQVRMSIEAQLSMGLPNTPMAGAALRVVSGNFVTAQPYGIRNGIDFCQTGNVRNVDASAIKQHLKNENVVLVSPIGYSPTGEIFNLRAEDVATETAIALNADKLIFVMEDNQVTDNNGNLLQQLNLPQAEAWLQNHDGGNEETQIHLNNAAQACRGGVRRVHLLSRQHDGALLQELYTRDGIGTLVTAENYEGLRHAVIDDIGGIMELISPLEEQGVLVKRSREQLELDINNFTVIERDGMIIACAALFTFADTAAAELACLAVHKDYQEHGRGDDLIQHIEWQARKTHMKKLFTLTTQAMHWFIERGFLECDIADLPIEKKSLYNYQRNSKILCKQLN